MSLYCILFCLHHSRPTSPFSAFYFFKTNLLSFLSPPFMVDVLDLFVFTASGTRRTTQNPGTSSIRPTSTRWFIPSQTQESCKSLLIPNASARKVRREKMAPRHRVSENLTAVTSLEKQDRTAQPKWCQINTAASQDFCTSDQTQTESQSISPKQINAEGAGRFLFIFGWQ